MLLKLSTQIGDCLERARLSRERADKTADPILKDDYLSIEQHWLRLAESYRTAERVETFIAGATRELGGSDAEVEGLAERIVGKA